MGKTKQTNFSTPKPKNLAKTNDKTKKPKKQNFSTPKTKKLTKSKGKTKKTRKTKFFYPKGVLGLELGFKNLVFLFFLVFPWVLARFFGFGVAKI